LRGAPDDEEECQVTMVRGSERAVAVGGAGLPTLQRLVDRDAGSHAITVLVNTFQGGQRVPTHSHAVEEVLLVIHDTCTFRVGEDTVVASAGDAMIVPPDPNHGIFHAGPEPASVLAVLASPDAEIASFP
jgi:quercetin dioxygenase-like cupin family protein